MISPIFVTPYVSIWSETDLKLRLPQMRSKLAPPWIVDWTLRPSTLLFSTL
jgi:hypothetical protein